MTFDGGRQVRAAQGWAGFSDDDMAKAIGVSKRTLGRLKKGTELSHERCKAIAAATGVPEWFMASGFDGARAPEELDLAEQVEFLDNRLNTLYGIVLNQIAGGAGSLSSGRPEADEGSGNAGSKDRPH